MTCTRLHLTDEQIQGLFAEADAASAKRATDMPTEQDAIDAMFEAYLRLKELGWNDAIYCPKDGSEFDAVEPGSTGIHKTHYSGEWPDGTWWTFDGGDLWPSRPVLYRPNEEERARWARLSAASVDRSPEGGNGVAGAVEDESATRSEAKGDAND